MRKNNLRFYLLRIDFFENKIEIMKILLINTFDNYGGAALACKRLLKALNQTADVEAKLLVQVKKTEDDTVFGLANGYFSKKKAFFRFALERLGFYWYEKNKSVRFAFSPANVGVDISSHPLVLEADILHLHWTNFGFLSLNSLEKLIRLGKPIVWTLHDMWTFTGGCHYVGDCLNYQSKCGNCQFLKNPQPKDWSYQIFQQKFQLFYHSNIQLVACSRWLADKANQSALLKRSTNSQKKFIIRAIPNPIDISIFKPIDKTVARQHFQLPKDKFLLLFGAMNLNDTRKGFQYLKEALQILAKKNPSIHQKIELLVFGKSDINTFVDIPFEVNNLGFLSNQTALINAYNAADVFVLPSLEDNLPNTVTEALACGTPAIAFDTGGLPEMIDHQQNGYLAEYKSAEDLAKGIAFIFQYQNQTELQANARNKAVSYFSEARIVNLYKEVYLTVSQK